MILPVRAFFHSLKIVYQDAGAKTEKYFREKIIFL